MIDIGSLPDLLAPVPLARSYDVLGFRLTPSTTEELLAVVRAHVECGVPAVIASQNMHGMYVHLADEEFRALHASAATYVHIDGMPLILLCRLGGIPVSRRHRVTWVDFIDPLLALADSQRWRVYYLGGTSETVSTGLTTIRSRYRRATFSGHHGHFEDDSPTHAMVLADIRATKPHVLLLGMGMGRQEQWIMRHGRQLDVPITCTTGACLEYVAGNARTPPRWMGRSGLEWAFRLAENPRRFGSRYLFEPWVVVAALLSRYASGGGARHEN